MNGRVLGRVVSVNVGEPRTVTWLGREVTSAIWKSPVEGPVHAAGHNLAGDRQADLRVHGGNDKAVYTYAGEDYEWWTNLMPEVEFHAGRFGENLTTTGLDPGQAVIGEVWRIGSVTFEVCQPRFPCAKLGMRMGDTSFVERFADARRPGAYLRIAEEGQVQADDRIVLVDRPDHDLRIIDLVVGHRDRNAPTELLERIAANPLVLEGYRASATRALARR